LEDLSSDHKLFENEESLLDLEHLMVALKSLAILHAAAVNYEAENGGLLKNFPGCLEENSYRDGLRKYRLENAIGVFLVCLPEIAGLREETRFEEIVRKWPELMRKIYEFCRPSSRWRNVLLHGDLWRNNLMFRYLENGEFSRQNFPFQTVKIKRQISPLDPSKPIACKFVDFQFSRYGPAAFDVMTLIVLTTYRSFRETHMETLLNFYYANFLSRISQPSIPIESFQVFRESCEAYNLAALIEKAQFTHYPPKLPDNLTAHIQVDYTGDNYITNFPFELARIAYQNDEKYRRRLEDVVFEVCEKFIDF
jgi:hypothetical protein